MFWQVQGEKEEVREGSTLQKAKLAALDIGSGVLSGNIIAYFIIVATSATLFSHHQEIFSPFPAFRRKSKLSFRLGGGLGLISPGSREIRGEAGVKDGIIR